MAKSVIGTISFDVLAMCDKPLRITVMRPGAESPIMTVRFNPRAKIHLTLSQLAAFAVMPRSHITIEVSQDE